MALLTAENVSFSYDKKHKAIDDVSISVERGEYVAIIGHNGSGKSTLARLFNALLIPDSGKITVDGFCSADKKSLFEIRKRVGVVFQNPDNQLVATVVEEDVAFGPENLGVPREEIRRRVDDALRTVGMYDYKDSQPHRLSGGQKQRVAIAGVIAMMPECIVFDESTAMLDPRGRAEVMETIRRLNREHGITVLHITHYMDEAVRADRVMVVNDGKLFADGTPKAVFCDVAALRRVGLDVPQGRELLYALAARGISFADTPIDIDGCAALILERVQSRVQ